MPTAAEELAHLESHVQEAVQAFAKDRRKAASYLRKLHPRFRGATLPKILDARLTEDDARLVVAREHGFDSWDAISAEAAKGARARWNLPIHERTGDGAMANAIRSVNAGKARDLARLLEADPALARRRVRLEQAGPFSNPSLLEIAAATHQRRDRVPPNLLDILELLLAKKPGQRAVQNALNLAAAKPWPKQPETQRRVIRRLIKAGAKPEPAMPRAVFQSSTVALGELVRHGGKLDLVACAAMGKTAELKKRLPRASPLERRKALSLAAVNGQTDSVRILLDAGLDPNRFNPRGFYEHSLPIHQAVWFGHLATVKLLAEHGTDLSVRDKQHNGTPLGWAEYGKQKQIVNYLKSRTAAA